MNSLEDEALASLSHSVRGNNSGFGGGGGGFGGGGFGGGGGGGGFGGGGGGFGGGGGGFGGDGGGFGGDGSGFGGDGSGFGGGGSSNSSNKNRNEKQQNNLNLEIDTPSISPEKFNVSAKLTYGTPTNPTTISTPAASSQQSIKNEIIAPLPAPTHSIIASASASPAQHNLTLNIPALPLLSMQSPSTENNNVNLVIDVPMDNAEPNIVAATDNLSASPSNVGSM